jgi:uncharacterized membrane protein YphA (DoxX/SURF4 family)
MSSSAPAVSSAQRPNRGLHIGLWVVQVLLAIVFVMAGLAKLMAPAAELAKATGAIVLPVGMVRFIGVAELAGALGLILPSLTRIRPGLTPLAAAGLVVVMVLATGYHIVREEFASVPVTTLIGVLAAFVAWGRFKKAPISPRG